MVCPFYCVNVVYGEVFTWTQGGNKPQLGRPDTSPRSPAAVEGFGTGANLARAMRVVMGPAQMVVLAKPGST